MLHTINKLSGVLLCALAITSAAVAVSYAGEPSPGPGSCFIFASCAHPDVAPSVVPFPSNPGGDASDCASLCDKWVKSCQGMAKVIDTCLDQSFAKFFPLASADCQTLENPARKECTDSLKAQRDLCKAQVTEAREATEVECESSRSACEEACQGPPV